MGSSKQNPHSSGLAVLLLTAVLCVMSGAAQRLPACAPVPNAVCTCSGTNVQCNNIQPPLQRVPSFIPESTEVLNLAGNEIRQILKGDFIRLEHLRTIFLQSNTINYIQPGALDNLYHLQLVVMTGNRLVSIPEKVWQHLPSITSINLSNNQISTIEKRAFLTLPASENAITITLTDNPLNCNCNARAIRDWKDTLPAAQLSPITFEGFTCPSSVQLDDMLDDDFPTCSQSARSMFDSSLSCVSCVSAKTHHDCDMNSTVSCRGQNERVCQSETRIVNGQLFIAKQCGVSYRECLLKERNNARLCNVTHSGPINAMQCTFCCVGNECNAKDYGGRTVSYKIYVGLRLTVPFEPFMLNPADPLYTNQAQIYETTLTSLFDTDGGYSVKFLSFRDETPSTYVSTVVHTTNLNWFSVAQVATLMTEKLNRSSTTLNSLLQTRRVTYIYVGTELDTAKKCMRETTETEVGPLTWGETSRGTTSLVSCPSGTVPDASASRLCMMNINTGLAEWASPDVSKCKSTTSDTTRLLTELSSTPITSGNVNSVLTQLRTLSQDGAALTASDVSLVMDTVDRVLGRRDSLSNPFALQATVSVLSNLLDARPEVLAEANQQADSANRLMAAADKISEEGQLSGGRLMLPAGNLVVAAQSVDRANFQGLTLTSGSETAEFGEGDVVVEPMVSTPPSGTNSLVLPRSLLTSASGSRVAMTVQQNGKVYEAIRNPGGTSTSDGAAVENAEFVTKINSHVMAASVVGHDVSNLQDPVIFTLVHDSKNSANPRCVFWDVPSQDWSSRGCSKVDGRSNENVTTCQCDHLTNFALLMDVYNEGGGLSDTDSKILSIISYIGCGISLLALLLTLLTYFLFKKLRRDNPSKILVNLCIALALSNLVFVAGMHPYAWENTVGCKVVAALLHFSLLSSLCWMAVEAFYMYLALVLVFKTYYTNFILKCSIVGWGIPLVVVIVTLAVNGTDNYGPLDTGVCWIKGVAFYAAFVGPVALILLINVIAFAMVVHQIMGMKDRKLNKSDSFTAAQQLRGALGVAILLGLTWVFGFVAVAQAAVVFYYLFAIFNTLQGLWIFIFYCVMKKEARNSWARTLPCCRFLDDKSSATTSKAAYSATAAGHHGAGKASTDSSSQSHTHSTSVTASRSFASESESEVTYVNGGVSKAGQIDPPYANLHKTPVVDADGVYVNLNTHVSSKNSYDVNTSPPSSPVRGTVTAITSDGKVSTTVTSSPPPSASRPIQFHTGKTATLRNGGPSTKKDEDENKVVITVPSSPTGKSDDPRLSPRPLHFKLGHAYSLEPTPDSKDTQLGSPPPESEDSRSSVADMIKKLNTKM